MRRKVNMCPYLWQCFVMVLLRDQSLVKSTLGTVKTELSFMLDWNNSKDVHVQTEICTVHTSATNPTSTGLFYWHSVRTLAWCYFQYFFCRVGDPTGQASHLVPETDGGLQECDDHRPDVFLAKRHRPLCPHPQVQPSADVGAHIRY